MSFFNSLSALWRDPPPGMAFELSEAGIAMARTGKNPEFAFRPLEPGVVSVSPLRDNILQPDRFAGAVRSLVPPNGARRRRNAALILPDACARVWVLDFDDFPSDPREQRSLVQFRLKKSVPYDIEAAALSYFSQAPNGKNKKHDVVVAVAPFEIVSRYEAPFRALAIEPGYVTTSALAALDLVTENGTFAVAKLSGRMLTILVISSGVLKLVRSLELAEAAIGEISADLYPTFIYIEDQLGEKAGKLLLAGFGNFGAEARDQFARELHLPVELIGSRVGVAGDHNLGLLGYLQSFAV